MTAANAADEMQAKISGLKDRGVKLEVCANTLKGRNVPMDGLYDTSEGDRIPSGVAELLPAPAARLHLHRALALLTSVLRGCERLCLR